MLASDAEDFEDDFIISANCGTLPSLEDHNFVTVAKSSVQDSQPLDVSDMESEQDDLDGNVRNIADLLSNLEVKKPQSKSLIDEKFDKVCFTFAVKFSSHKYFSDFGTI